jgi:hypothetical protein
MEMIVCQYFATDMLHHVATRDEILTITNIVMTVLGEKQPSTEVHKSCASYEDVSNFVQNVRDTIDVFGDGKLICMTYHKYSRGKPKGDCFLTIIYSPINFD